MPNIASDPDIEFHLRPPYQLVLLGNRLNAANSQYYLGRYGVGVMEGRILCTLAEDQEATASEICFKLGMDQASASRTVRTLLATGYIEMFNDSRDARRRLLKLTPAGHKLQRELVADILERTQIALLGFTRGEQVLLSEFIERLTNNVTLLEKANE